MALPNRAEQLSSTRTLKVGTAALLALTTALLMSVAAATIKWLTPIVSVEMILLVQYLTCAALMLPWIAKNGIQDLKTRHIGLHVARAACGWTCLYMYFLAIKHIPLVDAILLRNAAPLCVPIWALFWLKIRIPAISWLPLILGFFGIALVLQPSSEEVKVWHILGFASAIGMAGSVVTTRVLSLTEPTPRVMFYYFFISSLFTVPLIALNEISIPAKALPYMMGIGLFTFIAMWCYTRALEYASATIVSPINYFGVIFAGFWSWLFWDQIPSSAALWGAVFVIFGGIGSVVLGQRGAKNNNHLK